jgi:hypothetical protein
MSNQKYTLEVKEDPDTKDLFLELPPEILSVLKWKEGDTLVWTKNSDSSWSLSKKEQQ